MSEPKTGWQCNRCGELPLVEVAYDNSCTRCGDHVVYHGKAEKIPDFTIKELEIIREIIRDVIEYEMVFIPNAKESSLPELLQKIKNKIEGRKR